MKNLYKKLIIITVAAIIAIQTQTAFGDDEEIDYRVYEEIDYRLKGPPTYCAVIPEGDIGPAISQVFLKHTEDAVNEWKSKLLRFETTNNAVWDMKFEKITATEIKTKKCDILIMWKKTTQTPDSPYFVIGYFNVTEHTIQIIFNKNRDNYKGFFETVKHEIGHTLGLGHLRYWPYDRDAFSIMIRELPSEYLEFIQITDYDALEIRKIYGKYGFYSFANPIPPHIILSMKNFTESIIPNKFESFKISDNIIVVDSYKPKTVKISGTIYKQDILRGIPVYVIFTSPSGKTEQVQTYPTAKGFFETQLTIDSESERGIYTIEPMYNKFVQKNMSTKIQVLDQKKETIPIWVKNNAKWWSEDKINDDDFVSGIQYMIDKQIIKISKSKPTMLDDKIPVWIKHNAGWWANNIISEDEFVASLQYLISRGII